MKISKGGGCLAVYGLFSFALSAQSLETIRGVVHDPQHHPLRAAQITAQCGSAPALTVQSNDDGEFQFAKLPTGTCELTVSAANFRKQQQQIGARARSSVLHFQLELAQLTQSVDVQASRLETQVSTVQSLTSAQEVEQTPAQIKPTACR